MKALIVVDMQNDFIDGALGSAEAQAIVPNVVARIKEYMAAGEAVLFTRDTHPKEYLETQEGSRLPVPHCIKGTPGWELAPAIQEVFPQWKQAVINKPTFGSVGLGDVLAHIDDRGDLEAVELIGLCTDICVISNAMLLKAYFPEVPIAVKADCCAGVTPQSHQNALEAMKMCQIDVI